MLASEEAEESRLAELLRVCASLTSLTVLLPPSLIGLRTSADRLSQRTSVSAPIRDAQPNGSCTLCSCVPVSLGCICAVWVASVACASASAVTSTCDAEILSKCVVAGDDNDCTAK